MRPTALLLAGLLATGASAAPRLHVSTPSLVPESTIEVVLDRSAAGESAIGKVAPPGWVGIRPAWNGSWRWKEANVLEFQPSAPPSLGANYTFSLGTGHRHLDGTEIPAGKLADIATESLTVDYATVLERYEDGWSPRTVTYFLRFNGEVTPADCAPFLSFQSAKGQRVAARTERATTGRLKHEGYLGSSWSERFQKRLGGDAPAPTPDNALPNGLTVTPQQPLPEGENWQLVMLAGLPDATGAAKLGADTTRYVGDIDPLTVTSVEARVVADEPRRIVVDFNLPLAAGTASEEIARRITVAPQPADMDVTVAGDEIRITGDFSATHPWQVTVAPGLVSYDGRGLEKEITKSVTFRPLKPEVGLPSEAESQLASGHRTYRVQTVNLDKVRIRVKRLDAAQLVRAQQGYRHYTGIGHDGKPLKPTHLLPYEMMAGETIADFEIPFSNGMDTTQPLVLDWNKLLAGNEKPYTLGFPKEDEDTPAATGEKRPAAFFLEVAGTPKPGIPAWKDNDEAGNPDDGEAPGPAKSPVAQALVQLTDLGLAWKVSDGETRVLAFSCLTGQPLPGVALTTFGEDAVKLGAATTGADGMAVLPRDTAIRHLCADHEGDRFSVACDATLPTVGLWRFPVRFSWDEKPASRRRAFLFTDRSLYRPGEMVHFKGIVRHQEGNAIAREAPAAGQLVVTDPAGRELLREDLTPSASGGFDASFRLPEETTGYHRISWVYPQELAEMDKTESWFERARIQNNASFSLGIRVEEFRRNAFELTQEIATPPPGAEEVSVSLKAAYYQGQPVARGEAQHFTHVEETNFYPGTFRDYLFGDHRTQDFAYWYHYFGYRWDDDHGSRRSDSTTGKVTLDAGGAAGFTVKLPGVEFPMAREVTVSTEVTDANRQTLSERTTATVHPASLYAGISRLDRLVRTGDRIPLDVIAVGTDGQAWKGEVAMTARVSREVNDQVRLAADEGGSAVRNEARREELSSTELSLSDGEGTQFLFAPSQPGLHWIELRGKDPDGRDFATAVAVHVYGGDEYPWAYEDGMRLKLVAEKKLYRPGETARVLVLSPIEGTAIVTVEREKVLRSFTLPLKADKPVIEIPLTDEDAPNAYVSVLVIKGAADSVRRHPEPQLRLGYCELTVENVRDTLATTLKLPEESVTPGSAVEITGSVVLADGSPAAGAEVTLYAEDEGTLAVMGYETPEPMRHFYDPRDLLVDCGTTLDDFIPESPEEITFFNKGFFVGEGDEGAKGGADGFAPPALRRDFDPCAGWQPALIADASGKFTATFTMPDTLTRYRVIAVAHHGESRFGHTEGALVVNKPLTVEPQSPRFANEGDTLQVRALVRNASGQTGTWKIAFSPNPAASDPVAESADGTLETTVDLADGASATVTFPVVFRNTGEAVLTWTATPVSLDTAVLTPVLATRLSDRVEARFPVTYPVPLLRQHRLVTVPREGIDLLKGLNPELLAGRGSVELEFSRSLLAEAGSSADYLLTYPYGCLEQTTSSMMPWLAVEPLRGVVPAFASRKPEDVRGALQKGVNRLISMQQANGGFTYWPGSEDTVQWASSYAGLGLVLARNAGASVPEESVRSLVAHLIGALQNLGASESSTELENICLAVWVLAIAEQEVSAPINALTDRIADLNPRARCLLALAAHTAGHGDAAAILKNKAKPQLKDDGWMAWQNDDALHLLAWCAVDPEAKETTAALDKLLRSRNPYGHWRTTWVNAWSLMALAAYAENRDESEPATLTLRGVGEPRVLTLESGKASAPVELSLGELATATLTASSDQTCYVRVKLASKPELAPQQPVAKNGMEITRYYERVHPDGTAEPLDKPRPGDLVRVRLKVSLPEDDSRYLVIEDRLPAIFEAINQDFDSQSTQGRTGAGQGRDWRISHQEIRGDRAVFFYDLVSKAGTEEITYMVRCTMDGKAVAPPAKVESMYDPDEVALSASREF